MPTEHPEMDDDQIHEIWVQWKRAHRYVDEAVVSASTEASGLTQAELSVLLRLGAAPGGLRQHTLAEALEWHRSRLSHQLTRMETRGLVERAGSEDHGVMVRPTEEGLRKLNSARPAQLKAIRRTLIGPLNRIEVTALSALTGRIAAPFTGPDGINEPLDDSGPAPGTTPSW
ncbi:MarR family winged helix-turn-helix transcriptional regulator [uncultured Propionibacterium sp.]|uniref:MarR family winged helix-turn-helix transcriptional regulator n=1 Tax=uncultured Propionibacterium sp. TaxID=218066 RepID=UPI00292D9A3B|nr:MarR family winged helix-turn-helix transcriptional regulator [uncultured Propionibacterium sp.]